MDGIRGGEHMDAQLHALAGRLVSCSARVEQVLGGFQDIQMLDWQSPAGRAYRDAVTLQAASLRRALDRLQEAGNALARRAQQGPIPSLASSSRPG
ncbi:hypothetical protein GCM10007170_20460 [Arthrobacter liuii]|uniref:WXG100 family type VII secretion target n=1 Tax=Arthrobacter liuii TaxID=1476996 RepID=A0ABQ2AQ77_9MICC|nr:hypothetical protein GCM10007170_20460 [Arthrobacter liuii]